MKRFLSSVLSLTLVVVGFSVDPPRTAAKDIAGHSPTTNDRFANDGSLITGVLDLSGIGRTSDGNWATRIGENYFLTAKHFKPSSELNENVTFFATNDPDGNSFTYQMAGGFQIGSTDLYLGYFNESIHSSIISYSYNMTPADSLSEAGILNEDLYMFGNSPTANDAYGGPGRLTDMAVAQNQAESWAEQGTSTVIAAGVSNNFSEIGWDQVVTFQNEAGDTANVFQTHEGQLQSGDSGSPLMTVSGGQLVVQGIAYAVDGTVDGLTGNFIDTRGKDPLENRHGSFFSYTGSYTGQINGAIANVPSPVPEPGTLLLLGVCSLAVMARRRRR